MIKRMDEVDRMPESWQKVAELKLQKVSKISFETGRLVIRTDKSSCQKKDILLLVMQYMNSDQLV